jgi:hypothetical protein
MINNRLNIELTQDKIIEIVNPSNAYISIKLECQTEVYLDTTIACYKNTYIYDLCLYNKLCKKCQDYNLCSLIYLELNYKNSNIKLNNINYINVEQKIELRNKLSSKRPIIYFIHSNNKIYYNGIFHYINRRNIIYLD